MTRERWARIKEVFGEALEKSDSARGVFLEEACGGDEELRQDVERLLENESNASLTSPARALAGTDLAAGEMLGRYRVEEKLGQGGMGQVYRAIDTVLRRTVAVKILRAGDAATLESRQRLTREAQAASALNHPNIVTVHDVGCERGVDFIAMEYVAGATLDRLIGDRGLGLQRTLRYAIQVADALEAAHAAGVVHRDLKPGNIRVTDADVVKVLDFGLAKRAESVSTGADDTATEDANTVTGTVLGTVSYMSPEQAEGKPVDARSDVFSFGAV